MRLIGLVVLALALGCSSPFENRGTPCGEYRNTSGVGAIADASATPLGTINVYVNETRDSTRRPDIVIQAIASDTVTGGPLKGHLARIRYVSSSGTVLGEDSVVLPAGFSRAWLFSQNVLVNDPALLRSTLIAGALRVELITDDSPARVLTVPIRLDKAGDWYTLRCV